jgi:hypothetical protein
LYLSLVVNGASWMRLSSNLTNVCAYSQCAALGCQSCDGINRSTAARCGRTVQAHKHTRDNHGCSQCAMRGPSGHRCGPAPCHAWPSAMPCAAQCHAMRGPVGTGAAAAATERASNCRQCTLGRLPSGVAHDEGKGRPQAVTCGSVVRCALDIEGMRRP